MIYRSKYNKTIIYLNHGCGYNLFIELEKKGLVEKVKDYKDNLYSGHERILLVRNPYDRIMHFYQTKFKDSKTYLQKCHKRIKKYTNVSIDKLLFKDIIEAIKNGYRDSHIFPLENKRKYNSKKKFESSIDRKYIEDLFKIKIPKDTDSIYELNEWCLSTRKIINNVYSIDFHKFNYTMLPILYVENKKIFKNWASKTYEYKYIKISECDDFKVLDIGDESINDINTDNYTHIIFGWHGIPINKYYNIPRHNYYKKHIPHLETSDEVENRINKLLKIKHKAIVVQDMHSGDYNGGLSNFCKYIKEYEFEYIITPYLKTAQVDYIKKKCPEVKIYHVPHFIDETLFKNWTTKNKYDILLFGNDDIKYYPFRNRVMKLVLDNRDKFRVGHIPRNRNYFKYNKKISNDNLSRSINKSLLTLCTSSKYDFLLGKYFETSMSGGVVVGNMPEDGKSIWENNFIEINNDMSDNEILKTISDAINDKSKLNDIKENMLIKMKEFHLDRYTEKLKSLFF